MRFPLRRCFLFGLLLLCNAYPAHALPAFARQTGEACADCHVGSFGPQLTPHGMKFKLGGYSDRSTKTLPLSGMLVGAYSHVKPGIAGTANDRTEVQEASAFLAGRWAENLGSFIQATTSSDAKGNFSMDNVDVRYARSLTLGGSDTILGASLNDNPTVQDPLNTVMAWHFPYMQSEDIKPMASPLLDGALATQVVGLTAYGLWNEHVYGEFGGYRSLPLSFQDNIANGNSKSAPTGLQVDGFAPYYRLAYIQDLHTDAWSVGLMGLNANLLPDYAAGPSDKYRDIGFDASYQHLGNRKHIFTLNAAYVREHVALDATDPGNSVELKRFDLSGSWHYAETYGATLAYFSIDGTSNAARYPDTADGTGSANHTPNSRGYTVQVDWTPLGKEESWGEPWANVRLGLQYTLYTKFNGASQGYDGSGRNASDNNTLYAFIWTAF